MQEMKTIDSMVAYEIRNSAWAEVLHEDAYVVGRKIERAIFDELIEDILIEVFIWQNQADAYIDKRLEQQISSFNVKVACLGNSALYYV